MSNFSSNTNVQYVSQKRISAWSVHSDAHMVVLAEDPMFLALNVVVSYLSAYSDGSKRNALLASHSWVHPYVNFKKGFGKKALNRLAEKLRKSPRQAALLLESEHILMTQDVRIAQMRKAYGYFIERGATDITDLIECFFNAVSMVEDERKYDARIAASKRNQHIQKLVNLVAKAKTLSSARVRIVISLSTLPGLKGVIKVMSPREAEREVWAYLVGPVE